MSRITLAFACFFRLLFTGRLPARAAERLPEGAQPRQIPERAASDDNATGADGDGERAADKARASARADKPAAKRSAPAVGDSQRDGALAFLGLLQREGRLIDFLNESLDDYQDADIGAAVRDIHRGCKKVLDEHLAMEPVMPGDEDDEVEVPAGFDPSEVRLIGEVGDKPPFAGVLRHHGWRVTEARLPALTEGIDRRVIAPAEVEVK